MKNFDHVFFSAYYQTDYIYVYGIWKLELYDYQQYKTKGKYIAYRGILYYGRVMKKQVSRREVA